MDYESIVDILTAAPRRPENLVDALTYPAIDIPQLEFNYGEPQTGPVVAIDVDGVLNCLGPDEFLSGEARRIPACIPSWATAEAKMLHGGGKVNHQIQITVDPAHGEWIKSLLDRGITVVWCTSWETAAPVVYGHLLDLPPMPVIMLKIEAYGDYAENVDSKAIALERLFPFRPLVWLDDHAVRYTNGWNTHYSSRHATFPSFVPEIDPRTGLTPEIMREVDSWLAGHPGGSESELHKLAGGDEGDWRIATSLGVVRLQNHDRRLRRLSPALARQTGLTGGWTWEGHLDDIEVGARLQLHVRKDGASWTDPATAYDLGIVRSIRFLGWPENKVPDEGGNQYWMPKLQLRRRVQEEFQQSASRFSGLSDLAVKDGTAIAFWDSDVPVRLAVVDGFFELRAQVASGEMEGRTKYSDVLIATGKSWDLGDSRRVMRGGDEPALHADTALNFAVDAYRDWRRRSECEHAESTARFCSECGEALDEERNRH